MSETEIKENIKEIEIKEDNEPVPLLKPKKKTGPKTKYPRTEKQQEQFELVMKKRAENVARRKEEKKIEAAKLLLQNEAKIKQIKKELPPATPPQTPRVYDDESTSDSDSYERYERYIPKVKTKKIYVIKKKSKKKYESSSSSEEEEEEPKPVAKNKFKSQRNKKSVIKVTEPKMIHNIPTYKNYFCD